MTEFGTALSLPSTPPLTPPHREEEWLDWLRLLRSRKVGIATFYRLMDAHGSARAALDALPGIARDAGIDDYETCPRDVVRDEWGRAQAAGATPVAIGSPHYPAALAEISDAPPILWARGDLDLLSRPTIALVGARNASSLGLRMARSLSGALGREGLATVSGLARGIDTAAHEASLETGTIAVMAGGVDVIYPTENTDLAARIAKTGLLVSEQPVGTRPQGRHFPSRNRIISGLSGAVVVVEAAAKSGSLITARDAADQGREVLAVPGHPFDARAAGCNQLIREGATLVRGPRDVIEALHAVAPVAPEPEAPAPAPAPPLPQGDDLRALILDRLGPSPTAEDQIIHDLRQPAARIAAEIVSLELDGQLARSPGGLLSRVE